MGILSRNVFREIISSAVLGTTLFTFVLFLRELGKLFNYLVTSSAPPALTALLFGLVFPPVLTLTVPVGVLVGVLIALGRMSTDGEIIAMRAAGVPSRRVLFPVMTFAVLGTAVAGACSLWLTPLATRETYHILNDLIASQLTAEIQPRVFSEQFPNTILYISDVVPTDPVKWRRIFIADITPPDKRQGGTNPHEAGEGPRITVADEALALPDIRHNNIQLSMSRVRTHEAAADPQRYYNTAFPKGDQVLEAMQRDELTPKGFTAMSTRLLLKNPRETVDAQIELHRRFALPLACLLMALVGIPLGVSSRKGGKSLAFVLTVLLAFAYYMGLISMIGLAQRGTMKAWIAVWTPNTVLFLIGLVLFARLDQPGDRDWTTSVRAAYDAIARRISARLEKVRPNTSTRRSIRRRLFLLPQIIDTYVLRTFWFYFGVLLFSFVMMTIVYNFFELLGDIIKNHIAFTRVLTYFVFLSPKLVYDSSPMGVLVAVLVTFGILAKNNEVSAFKACGVSLHRLALPVMFSSIALSAGLFAFDYYIVPQANRIQDAIRAEIKGRPIQTYLDPGRKWILNDQDSRIYYYKYFDPSEQLMIGVQVFEFDPQPFQLRRHISAERARWEPSLNTWVFQNGWERRIQMVGDSFRDTWNDFRGKTATFKECDEPPSYFLKEVKQDKQMNFQELADYISDLKRSGFDTINLQVQYHKKFAVPLFALIMAMLSVPFAFMTGNRGAMAGVGISFVIAIAYWSVSLLFEQVGRVNQLPPMLAAWSPDALFSLAGMYLLARLRT
jgi:LPS export ABC transporter permease LptG/LPS export ABC transporter permease LptF